MPSKTLPRPAGFRSVTPYLLLSDAKAFIAFVTQAFGAEEHRMHVDPSGQIRHGELQIGDSILWIAQSNPDWPAMQTGLYLYVEDTDATYNKALAAGGTSIMAPADQFYGDRNAGVTDPCGNQWWIATHIEDVSEEELERRSQKAFAKQQG
ncbi:MAG: VOC family protein [Acidobacteriaceae bacterium]